MKKFLLVFMVLSSLATRAQEKNSSRMLIWADASSGVSEFSGRDEHLGVGINMAIRSHLLGFSFESVNRPLIDIFGPQGEPQLDYGSIWYGYLHQKKYGLLYAKAGISYTNYYFAADTVYDSGFFGVPVPDYQYKTKSGIGLPVEVGAGAKFHYVTLQAYASVLFFNEGTLPSVGIKIGLGYLP
ncbi:MAG TPA: hypothetical protein DCG19_08960 [Cryomorphaceae bacterium]|nr:hypothetical protein [Owenweeksia sp.]MBF98518.1 hypothetical protein [Owenweeksia sp.]HAD97524.1 hypothetical protein [Cryomorphaceae bacterium]HBF21198.1 hypothetical protein [Cryomorphaceae bacterium]|tara:strand:+ start:1323 stop:1874 length:552 start_codon:yes stop_codon:yes gene_type:complete